MKKLIFLLLLISLFESASAQTILNSFPIELKKSSSYFQILNAENQQQDYFAFIAEKEKVTVLKYNSALFFKDSISIPRPDKNFDFMVGTTFSADGNPNLYWSSKDYETIKVYTFDFKTHSTSSLVFVNDFEREKVVDVFVVANEVNIATITPDNQLKFTNFSNIGKSEYFVSLSSNNTAIENSKDNVFSELILENGITVIDSKLFTPLYIGVAKVKRYLNEKEFILTFDYKGQTTVFSIDLEDFSVEKQLFPYEKLAEESKSNSYLHQNVLYQITANSEALSFSAIDFETKEKIASYQANSKDEITFKNSPLLLQSESGKTRQLKKTSQFLSKIDYGNVGLTVYSSPNYNLFTIGGVREVASGGSLLLGLGLTVGGAFGGTYVDASTFSENNSQSIYFESYFDTNFKHVIKPFQPLYIDALGDFLNKNHPSVQNVIPYQNYVILNYYNSKTKEFMMRKFEDIFE